MRNFYSSVLCLTAALVLTACHSDARHSGNAPEGDRHPLPDAIGSGSGPAGNTAGHDVESDVLYGDLATKIYHRKGCKLLENVAERDRIPFLSAFDGYDAGYFPCDICRSGLR